MYYYIWKEKNNEVKQYDIELVRLNRPTHKAVVYILQIYTMLLLLFDHVRALVRFIGGEGDAVIHIFLYVGRSFNKG